MPGKCNRCERTTLGETGACGRWPCTILTPPGQIVKCELHVWTGASMAVGQGIECKKCGGWAASNRSGGLNSECPNDQPYTCTKCDRGISSHPSNQHKKHKCRECDGTGRLSK